MSSPELYFYYAPDERVYGPVNRITLEQWFKEGRLSPGSRLKKKSTEEFTTWEKVQSTPPEPPPLPSATPPRFEFTAPSDLPPTMEPDIQEAVSIPRNFPMLGALISEGFNLYRSKFWLIFFVGLLFQLPYGALSFITAHLQLTTPEAIIALANNSKAVLTILIVMLTTLLSQEFGNGVITLLVESVFSDQPRKLSEILAVISGMVVPIATSFILRCLLLFSGFFLAMIPIRATEVSHLPDIANALLYTLGFLFIVASLMMSIRLWLTTPVLVLEGRKILPAMQRSNLLVRNTPGFFLLPQGEFRLLFLALVPFFIHFVFMVFSQVILGIDTVATAGATSAPTSLSGFSLVSLSIADYLSESFVTGIYVTLLFLYYHHASERTEEP